MTKLTVHLCSKCGEQLMWTPDGSEHENTATDHLPDPGRILTMRWNPDSSSVEITSDISDADRRGI
jgi:hypothetical protein